MSSRSKRISNRDWNKFSLAPKEKTIPPSSVMSFEQEISRLEKALNSLKGANLDHLDDSAEISHMRNMEKHLLARTAASESYIANQIEDQCLSVAFTTLLVIGICFYLMGNVIIAHIRAWRCQCVTRTNDWKLVVEASRVTLAACPAVANAQQPPVSASPPSAPTACCASAPVSEAN